ncbi:X-linked retinitis pigmentosa GTPase regulator [Melipona quadrifasciata]|uniref:X-linked retinitis pigmentosa GTPase regulator n=1 Tax=Melipona quadrifasciata TaxID=166423 RepID=A0A0M9A254_9HYME|nr:X-linked retinitis pigmentosa GTPase regulator [Melipona quadrifasciata]
MINDVFALASQLFALQMHKQKLDRLVARAIFGAFLHFKRQEQYLQSDGADSQTISRRTFSYAKIRWSLSLVGMNTPPLYALLRAEGLLDYGLSTKIPNVDFCTKLPRSKLSASAAWSAKKLKPWLYTQCTETGRLFVFGSNDWGQLGLGHKNHISKPSCVKALKPEKVTHVACGRAHTLICTVLETQFYKCYLKKSVKRESSQKICKIPLNTFTSSKLFKGRTGNPSGSQKIFACGSDQEGQLGRGVSAIGDSSSTPVLVYDSGLAGSKIVQITAGSHHSLALTSDGGVLAWGSNLEGQLGLPDVSGLVNKPTKVHIPEPVRQITAGYYHSTFLTESGLVYVCGESEGGKLGIDVSFSTQIAPKQMQLPSPAVHVACGGHHTVILAENGSLYCTGSNSTGQLGLGTNLTELHAPKLLPRGALRNEKISRVSCGESHTAVVTESGKLYTCGDGRHGKLGLEENENNVHELTFVQRYKELFVSNVACGGCHTILVGQRRETNNRSQREENSQVEHIQKRNPLPPLKLSRRQSDARDDHETTRRKNSAESATSAQETVEVSLEKIDESNKDGGEERNAVTDSTNGIEKSDSPKNKEEASSMKTDAENNVQEEEKNNEEENNDETNAEATENSESDNGGDAERETSPMKGTSPSDSTPPPKPPRLKSGGESSSVERASSMEKGNDEDDKRRMEDEEKTEDVSEGKSDATEENESGKKEESRSMKSATRSGSTKSARSRVAEEETIEIDKQNDGDRVTEEEKVNSENAQDDADVVQSPAPKTGKEDDVINKCVNLTLCSLPSERTLCLNLANSLDFLFL